jgi:hypothetical protein
MIFFFEKIRLIRIFYCFFPLSMLILGQKSCFFRTHRPWNSTTELILVTIKETPLVIAMGKILVTVMGFDHAFGLRIVTIRPSHHLINFSISNFVDLFQSSFFFLFTLKNGWMSGWEEVSLISEFDLLGSGWLLVLLRSSRGAGLIESWKLSLSECSIPALTAKELYIYIYIWSRVRGTPLA